MPKLTKAVPKYRKHRASGQAVVTIGGRDHYLGPYGTKASRIEYDRIITEWLANDRQPVVTRDEAPALTVTELIARYWRFAQSYYVKDGRPTDSQDHIRLALRPLRKSYGHTPAVEFGPVALKAVRQRMLDAGCGRKYINTQVRRVVQMFKWAVAEELVPPSVLHALQAVPGLRKGRTTAPEGTGVEPVEDTIVDATLAHLGPIVADMVRFQRLTGCRPAEVCIVRPCDVRRSGDVWEYRPRIHKTEHCGRDRVILIGPKAQTVLAPYLLRPAEAFCFSPVEAVKKDLAERHANRSTPLSCGNRPGTNRRRKPKRKPRARYDRDSYRRAIHRACDQAKVERWSPNRLRHSAGTEIRRRYGLEAAQVVLGHAKADVTQVYAERDIELARRVIREVG